MAMMVELDKIREFPIRLHHFDEEHGDIKFVMGIESLMEYIEHLPSVEAEPIKRGRWEFHEVYGIKFYNCSKCGEAFWWKTNYCPNCGAKMDIPTQKTVGNALEALDEVEE